MVQAARWSRPPGGPLNPLREIRAVGVGMIRSLGQMGVPHGGMTSSVHWRTPWSAAPCVPCGFVYAQGVSDSLA